MTRSAYLKKIIELMTVEQIRQSAANPTKYMTRTHVLLHYAALRKLGA